MNSKEYPDFDNIAVGRATITDISMVHTKLKVTFCGGFEPNPAALLLADIPVPVPNPWYISACYKAAALGGAI